MKGDTVFSAALPVTHAPTFGALLVRGSSQPEQRGGPGHISTQLRGLRRSFHPFLLCTDGLGNGLCLQMMFFTNCCVSVVLVRQLLSVGYERFH